MAGMAMKIEATIVMVMVTAMTPMLTPSALPLKQFFLCHLLLLSRLHIYSSSCCTFCHPLLLHHPSVSMTALPLPSSLQCPNASRRKTLTVTLVLNAFALHHQPLAERSCRVRSCIDPDALPHCLCCFCCHCLHIVVIVVIAAVVFVSATPTIAELAPPVEPSHHLFLP
jgi:hypothetical protein